MQSADTALLRQTKVSNLHNLILPQEYITAGKVAVDDLTTSNVLLQRSIAPYHPLKHQTHSMEKMHVVYSNKVLHRYVQFRYTSII